jgi:hypothetical protein
MTELKCDATEATLKRLTVSIDQADEAHRRAESRRDSRARELSEAEARLVTAQAVTRSAQDAFDADPKTKAKYLQAQDAEREIGCDVERFRRLLAKADQDVDAAHLACLQARNEVAREWLTGETYKQSVGKIVEQLRAARSAIMNSCLELTDLKGMLGKVQREQKTIVFESGGRIVPEDYFVMPDLDRIERQIAEELQGVSSELHKARGDRQSGMYTPSNAAYQHATRI